jgi:hypothetical protein
VPKLGLCATCAAIESFMLYRHKALIVCDFEWSGGTLSQASSMSQQMKMGRSVIALFADLTFAVLTVAPLAIQPILCIELASINYHKQQPIKSAMHPQPNVQHPTTT